METNNKRKIDTSKDCQQPPKKKPKTNKKNRRKKQPTAWSSPQHCVSWLLFNKNGGVSTDKFFKDYFGKKPLHIRRNNANYYRQQQLKFELNDVYPIIKQNDLKFGQHMICKAYDGKTEQNAPWIKSNDKVSVTQFKKLLQKGYTTQFHHPQHFYPDITKMIGLLESYFGVEVGSNVYMTPNKKQGLAPHWDDVEVFVLQLEGTKHWKLYERSNDDDKYPLQSSDDLNLSTDCPDAQLLMECYLKPGDLLYFPRGTIHCAKTVGKLHSTHLTISTHQRTTWGDFMHTLIDNALNEAIDSNVELRKNMPLNFISFMGSTFEQNATDEMKEKQKVFMDKLKNITNNVLIDSLQNVVHDTCDVAAADFISHRLPPRLIKKQKRNKKELNVSETSKVCLKSVDWIRVANDDAFEDENEDDEVNETESDEDDDEDDDVYDDEHMHKDARKGFTVKMVNIASGNNEQDVTSFVDDSDDEKEENEEMDMDGDEEQFRLYTCLHNEVNTHCVEFADGPKSDKHSFIKLPMNLRPVVDVLVQSYPEKQTIRELYDVCSEQAVITLEEVQEFIKLLNDMELIHLK